MRRRDFIAAGAQQAAMPVIGFLNPISLEARRDLIAAFHQGLAKAGYAEGRNVTTEYRWAEARTIGCLSWLPI